MVHEKIVAAFDAAQLRPTVYQELEDGSVAVDLAKCVGKEGCSFGEAVIFPREPGWQIINYLVRDGAVAWARPAVKEKELKRIECAKAGNCEECPLNPKLKK